MDIFINKIIGKNEMQLFLKTIGENSTVLIYSEDDWTLVDNNKNSIEFFQKNKIDGVFNSGFSIHYKKDVIEQKIDYFAKEISKYFSCDAVSSSKFSIKEKLGHYNSIMYSKNKIYIVDDSKIDEIGEIKIIKEISPTTGST